MWKITDSKCKNFYDVRSKIYFSVTYVSAICNL